MDGNAGRGRRASRRRKAARVLLAVTAPAVTLIAVVARSAAVTGLAAASAFGRASAAARRSMIAVPGAAACGAGEAVVGAAEALLLAAGALAGACPGTPQPGDDRRRRPVRGRHRHPQHPELLHRSLVLHCPPVRRLGVPRGAHHPRAPEVSAHAGRTAFPQPATGAAHPAVTNPP